MRTFIFILLLFICGSCQISKIVNKTIDKKYERQGYSFFSIQSNKYNLTYWDAESNKPVLILLHGFGTWAKFNWHKQIEDLGESYRLIVPNLLHFGKSTCVNCNYTIDAQVAAMQTLIDSLGIKKMHLVGASYGGVVAMELSQKIPEKIEKLIIIDSPIKYFTEAEVKSVESNFGVSSISELLIPSDHKELKKLTSIVYKKPPKTPTFVYKSIYYDMFLPYTEEMTLALNSLLDSRAYLASRKYSFQKPILLIWGDEDKLVPKRVGKSLHEYFKSNSELLVIENTAHMPILEKPETCNKYILDFLSQE